jgi:hypothetical protein
MKASSRIAAILLYLSIIRGWKTGLRRIGSDFFAGSAGGPHLSSMRAKANIIYFALLRQWRRAKKYAASHLCERVMPAVRYIR